MLQYLSEPLMKESEIKHRDIQYNDGDGCSFLKFIVGSLTNRAFLLQYIYERSSQT